MGYKFSRKDGNHNAIAAALYAAGWQVMDTHTSKGGNARAAEGWFDNPGDLIVCKFNGIGAPVVVLVECKVPGGEVQESQKRLQTYWYGDVVIAHSPEEAVRLCEKIIWLSSPASLK